MVVDITPNLRTLSYTYPCTHTHTHTRTHAPRPTAQRSQAEFVRRWCALALHPRATGTWLQGGGHACVPITLTLTHTHHHLCLVGVRDLSNVLEPETRTIHAMHTYQHTHAQPKAKSCTIQSACDPLRKLFQEPNPETRITPVTPTKIEHLFLFCSRHSHRLWTTLS